MGAPGRPARSGGLKNAGTQAQRPFRARRCAGRMVDPPALRHMTPPGSRKLKRNPLCRSGDCAPGFAPVSLSKNSNRDESGTITTLYTYNYDTAGNLLENEQN